MIKNINHALIFLIYGIGSNKELFLQLKTKVLVDLAGLSV
jgi:hypothetical protein